MAATHGIKKVSENILAQGRAIVVTEKDKDKYTWGDIPDGSLFIDTATGMMAVKLEGQSDWVPVGIKNDGTINIAKDTITKVESFTIEQETVPGNKDEFIYTNSEGKQRHGTKKWNAGGTVLEGYIFTLEDGTYIMHRNHLKVTIDDILHRSVATGGIEEINEKQFLMTEKLEDKMEITVEYSAAFRMGVPYPRFFMNGEAPLQSEVGDFWLDTDGSLDECGPLENMEDDQKIGWDRIENKPTTLAGYGITDKLAPKDHGHVASDIKGLAEVEVAYAEKASYAKEAEHSIKADTADKADSVAVATSAIQDENGQRIIETYLKKDGKGATGTWDIDINGRADSARKAEKDAYGRVISDTYVTRNGATMSGALNLANDTWNLIGDDCYIGDFNHSGLVGFKGNNGATGIGLARRTNENDVATITYDGENIVFNKALQANITGNAASANYVDWKNIANKPDTYKAAGGTADSATNSSTITNDSSNMRFHWSGKNGQPTWVWGGNDAANMYIYNPSNFRVAYATEANHAVNADSAKKASDSDTVGGRKPGTSAGNVLVLDSNGKVPSSAVDKASSANYATQASFVCGGNQPSNPVANQIWFDTNSMLIKAYVNKAWKVFGNGSVIKLTGWNANTKKLDLDTL